MSRALFARNLLLTRLVIYHRGNVSALAREIEVNRTTLWRFIYDGYEPHRAEIRKALGLDDEDQDHSTPYAELATQHGQQRIVDGLAVHVLRGNLAGRGAQQLIEARNWTGALIVLRWLNQEKPMLTT